MPLVKPKLLKFRAPSLAGLSLVTFVCFTGFEFVQSELRHAPSRVRHGIYFALALILVLASPFIFTKKK